MLPAPKGGSRPRGLRSFTQRTHRFNAARPEGRESAERATGGELLIPRLQCCPPRRAGVGP